MGGVGHPISSGEINTHQDVMKKCHSRNLPTKKGTEQFPTRCHSFAPGTVTQGHRLTRFSDLALGYDYQIHFALHFRHLGWRWDGYYLANCEPMSPDSAIGSARPIVQENPESIVG